MSLRSRLTLLTAILIAAASSVLGVVVYVAAEQTQIHAVDQVLLTSAQVASRFNDRRGRQPEDEVISTIAIGRVRRDGTIQVIRQAGTPNALLPFPMLATTDLRAATTGPITLAAQSGQPAYRVFVARPQRGHGPTIVALPLDGEEAALDALRTGTIVAVLIVTALGAGLAWLTVRSAFRPVGEMITSAQAVAQGDLQRRVPDGRPGTELGDLSESLNTMIASLTTSITQVASSEARLRAFVSDASHEIRTPLTVIRGYVELLRGDGMTEESTRHRALERIAMESVRLERLVTALLTLDDAQNRTARVREPFRLDDVVRDTFTDVALLDPERPLLLDLAPIELVGSPDAWRQLCGNLVQNLQRYTPAASPVHVTLDQHPASTGGVVHLTVDDAGPGIPRDQRQEVLERFTRVDASRATSTGGFGLGMSIVRAVVEAHGGIITLADSPAGGLRVLIELPQSTTSPAVT